MLYYNWMPNEKHIRDTGVSYPWHITVHFIHSTSYESYKRTGGIRCRPTIGYSALRYPCYAERYVLFWRSHSGRTFLLIAALLQAYKTTARRNCLTEKLDEWREPLLNSKSGIGMMKIIHAEIKVGFVRRILTKYKVQVSYNIIGLSTSV